MAQRLDEHSDFLLSESAYAEIHFTERMWPDFGADDLSQALLWFRGRDRRFGILPESTLSVGAQNAPE